MRNCVEKGVVRDYVLEFNWGEGLWAGWHRFWGENWVWGAQGGYRDGEVLGVGEDGTEDVVIDRLTQFVQGEARTRRGARGLRLELWGRRC